MDLIATKSTNILVHLKFPVDCGDADDIFLCLEVHIRLENSNRALATTGSMLKAQINNKGIQWGLSNPNPLGMEVFQPRENFTWIKKNKKNTEY